MRPTVVPCSARLSLYFKGEKLRDMDTFSKSDPYIVLYSASGGVKGHEIGRTETKMNDLNPVFEKTIPIDFYFEQKQELMLIAYDDDGNGVAGDDVMATIKFQLAHVMSSRGHVLKLVAGSEPSHIYVSAVETGTNSKDILELTLGGRNLKKMDWFGLSDPYFKLSRVLPNGTKTPLYQSEAIDKTLDPNWRPCPKFTLGQLAGAKLTENTLELECWDKDIFSDDLIGIARFSVQDLIDRTAQGSQGITLGKPAKPGKRYGDIIVLNCNVTHLPSFADYLKGGQQINLAVSIDFTGSNGDPRDPRSLHYMNPHSPNQYVRAIMSVGEILMEYDTDKMVPAFGFGARIPNGQISHFFHLNMTDNPYVSGVQGVLDSYGRSLSAVQLAGPTNFAPTVKAVTRGARQAPTVYTVLLIITDGEITDMPETIDAIVDADDAPLSIVIVGVGDECDFEMMNQLDGDDGKLRSPRRICRRDLVQFVPFRNYERSPPGALAAEVLREIPEQFVLWAQIAGVKPGA